jgi:hypothetical protein
MDMCAKPQGDQKEIPDDLLYLKAFNEHMFSIGSDES